MNAVNVYVQTAQLLLRTEYNNTNNSIEQVSDLNRLLGQLRQLLACAVCSRLLNDPFSPGNRNCQHNVCRLCIRGRKCLRPPCSDCKDCQDFKTYNENPQMRCLLLCFKSLCEHVMSAQPLYQQICKQNPTLPSVVSAQPSTVPVNHMSTQEYIVEGANYNDITSAFASDLPRVLPTVTAVSRSTVPQQQQQQQQALTATSQMPPNATSAGAATSMPVSALHILAQTQTAPKASTPPINALPANTTPPTPITPALIKQEKSIVAVSVMSPPPPLAVVNSSSNISATIGSNNKLRRPTTTLGTQTVPIKHFIKSSPIVSTTNTSTASSNGTSNVTPTITYFGQNASSVIVPIVSSVTTNAPLSIASSRLQSLNRQLAQTRRTTAVSTNDTVPPLAFKVSLAPTSVSMQTLSGPNTSNAMTTTTATVTSQQLRNPPPIKTVSNGSAMYSVLYTGIGNKITIKRKTDGESDINHKKVISIPTSTASTSSTTTVFRQITVAKPTNQNKRRGCRCGNATPMPGKLTCCGQRCPCYVDSKSCIGCKCRGCRNPHRPDGGKVRPVIPELACYEIQMADESSSLSPKESSAITSVNTTTLPILKNTTITQQQQQQQQTHFEEYKLQAQPTHLNIVSHIGTTSSNTTTTVTPTATLIPFRTIHTTTQQQQQQQQQQQVQRITSLSGNGTQILSTPNNTTNNLLQLENLQRESVLIQNADGNYQVVNLFTAGNTSTHSHSGNAGQLNTLQRIHTIGNANAVSAATTSQAGGLQQIIVQQSTIHQPQMHQRHHNLSQRLISSSATTTTSSPTTTITTPLQQFQQHLKHNNLITVHPIPANHHNIHHHQPQQQQQHQQQHQHQHHTTSMTTTTPLISPAASITLSPIIVTSPNTLTTDMFSSSDGSTDEYLALNSMTPTTFNAAGSPSNISNGNSTTHLIAMPTNVNETQFSTISLDGLDGNTIITSTSAATAAATAGGMVAPTTAHLTPALVEVIESNELHAFQANGFAYN